MVIYDPKKAKNVSISFVKEMIKLEKLYMGLFLTQ